MDVVVRAAALVDEARDRIERVADGDDLAGFSGAVAGKEALSAIAKGAVVDEHRVAVNVLDAQ